MTGRILRIELRRSTATWLGAIFLIMSLALLFGLSGPWTHGSAPWNQQWTGLALWQRNLLTFSWPVVLGVGAWQGTRQRRSTMDELLASTPRPPWQRVSVLAGVLFLALAVVSLVLFAVGAVQVAAATEYFTLSWLPTLLVGILAVIAAAVLGMAIGHLLPYLVTPPVTAVAGLAFMSLPLNAASRANPAGPLALKVELLSPLLDGPRTAFTTVSSSVHFGQAVLFLGVIAAALMALAARGPRTKIVSAVPLVLGITLALTVLPARPAQAYPPDAAAAALVCDTDGPRICVTKAHQFLLPSFVSAGRKALAALAVLPNAPVSVQEVPDLELGQLDALPRPVNVLQVDMDDGDSRIWERPMTDPAELEMTMLLGAGTEPCAGYAKDGPHDNGESAARLAVMSWLARNRGDLRLHGEVTSAESVRARLLSFPAREQLRRVAALRQAGLTCNGNPLDILTHGGTG